jgi:prepilin peptidase CpaA
MSVGLLMVLITFVILMIAVAAFDLATMTIPNWLNLLIGGFFLVAALVFLMPLPLFAWHLAAGAGMLALCFGMFALGLIGGGDAKAAAAIALWLGPASLLEWGLWSAVFGGLLTIVLLLFRRVPVQQRLIRWPWLARLHRRETGVPYGIALAAAAAMIFPQSEFYLHVVNRSAF